MEFYMSGWKNIWEVEVPSVKKKGFSQDVMIREKVEPRRSKTERNDDEATFFLYEEEERTVLLQEGNAFGDLEATVLLGGAKRLVISVVRMRTGEVKEIYKTPFVMGKSTGCDFVINDNPTISRRHVQILKENGDYYLEDLGSSNFTYVDGEVIHNPVKILHNMIFRMSDEDFKISVELK